MFLQTDYSKRDLQKPMENVILKNICAEISLITYICFSQVFLKKSQTVIEV